MSSTSQDQGCIYTMCYGCRGANESSECGYPTWGCLLCETYGDRHGNLRLEYRHKEIVIGGQTFSPPQYTCLYCKDSKVYDYQIYIDSLIDDGWSDGGMHNMPIVQVACHSCCNTEHEKQYDKAKLKVLASYEDTQYL